MGLKQKNWGSQGEKLAKRDIETTAVTQKCTPKIYYPGQKNCYSREIHEVDRRSDHVISCDIELWFDSDATRGSCELQCCQVPVFVPIFTEIRPVIRSTEMQWSIPQVWKNQNQFRKFQSQTNFSFKLITHHAWGIDRSINLLLTNIDSQYFLKLDTCTILVPGWQHALWVFRAIPLYHKPGSFSPFFFIVSSSSSSSSSSSCIARNFRQEFNFVAFVKAIFLTKLNSWQFFFHKPEVWDQKNSIMNVKIYDNQKSDDRTTEEQTRADRCLTKINSWRTAWRSLLTKFFADSEIFCFI